MRTSLRQVLIALGWVLFTISVRAQLSYIAVNGTITINGYNGPVGDVVIPATINGLPVTCIGDSAFDGCTSLTSVTIPNSVTAIGNRAFTWCTSLRSVTIPNSVTLIGDMAFSFCSSLATISVDILNPYYISEDGVLFNSSQATLVQFPGGKAGGYTVPRTVTYIGNGAFGGCSHLTSVTIPDAVASIGMFAFDRCPILRTVYFQGNAPIVVDPASNFASPIVCYLAGTTGWGPTFGGCPTVLWDPQVAYTCATNSGSITITLYLGPGGNVDIPGVIYGLPVTRLGESAFDGCTSLTSVTIPNSVTGIGDYAFRACSSLSSTMIPDSVTTIGHDAFASCSSLTNVIIPDSVTYVADHAFQSCINLTSVTIPDSVTYIGINAFSFCTNLTSVTIPNSVTNIQNSAFLGCTRLTAITVDPLNSAYQSFEGVLFNKSRTMLIACPGGKAGSYAIPNSVSSIEYSAFQSCINLTSVTIPNSVTTMGRMAFTWCSSLTNVTILSGVTNIGYMAFRFCSNLTAITIPDSVTTIEMLAFQLCSRLGSVSIPDSVTSMGEGAFSMCDSLTNVTIGNSVTSIVKEAFRLCTNLTSVTIPRSVTSIGDYAFMFCTSLTEVYFQGKAPSIKGSSLFGDTNATVYYLPGTSGWGRTFGGRPTALWWLPHPVILTTTPDFGIQTNAFGFRISWATNASVVVEASTTLANPIWSPVSTNTLTDGWCYFSDAEWTNYPARFYRVRQW